MNLRDITEQFKRAANNAGAEAKHYAERFDSKLAEVRDSIQAQEDRYQVKYVTLTPGVLVGPPVGTFWELEHIAYTFPADPIVSSNASIRLNGTTHINSSKLVTMVADAAYTTFVPSVLPVGGEDIVWDEDINFTLREAQKIDLFSASDATVTAILEVREYSLEAVYNARASG